MVACILCTLEPHVTKYVYMLTAVPWAPGRLKSGSPRQISIFALPELPITISVLDICDSLENLKVHVYPERLKDKHTNVFLSLRSLELSELHSFQKARWDSTSCFSKI